MTLPQKISHSKSEKIRHFNPNEIGKIGMNIYGLPFSEEEADIVILPVPWEVTASYGIGTARGPEAIFKASPQIDFYDPEFPDLWKKGIFMKKISSDLTKKNDLLRKKTAQYIRFLEKGGDVSKNRPIQTTLDTLNQACKEMNEWVYSQTKNLLNQKKLVGVLGGEHSVPLGFYQALSERYNDFGILHFDAHMDLRKAYEGFEFSHASIMYNTLKLRQVQKLAQVGIRDFCEEELRIVKKNKNRVDVFTNLDMKKSLYEGKTWKKICEDIIRRLPKYVHVSFDIDVFVHALCPHTGTPVPGGLQFEESLYLLSLLAESGKVIIGFDLCEVSQNNDDWDGNVGARILYKLCGFMAKSRGILS
ncbi:agmatinase family protein [Candidatus Peregrinibacteria bacterium]|nr:agmatinase family protein [Candidatus Peregrinibacteria bacterium]